MQGGNAPDISTVDQIWQGAFAEAGAIVELDAQAKAAGLTQDGFFKGAWDSANYNGKLYGVPFNVDVWQFSFLNNALFKEAGIDPASISTFEGLKAAAEKLTDPAKGKYGVGLFGHLTRAQLYIVVALVWIVMLGWSKPWLDRFRYGPLEWLWRSLARYEWQPMRGSAFTTSR